MLHDEGMPPDERGEWRCRGVPSPAAVWSLAHVGFIFSDARATNASPEMSHNAASFVGRGRRGSY